MARVQLPNNCLELIDIVRGAGPRVAACRGSTQRARASDDITGPTLVSFDSSIPLCVIRHNQMENDLINVITICGSLRAGSYNAMVARSLPLLAPEGMSIKASPPLDAIPPYNADVQAKGFPDAVSALGEAIRAANGVIIVTPEYNYSIPGVLKNAIDWVSRLDNQPFKNQAVALQSASQGILGGARAQYHLRQSMVFLDAFVFNRPEILIASAKGKFDEAAGQISDEPARGLIRQQLAAFLPFVQRIKSAS